MQAAFAKMGLWRNGATKKERKSIVHSASNILMPLSAEKDVLKWWTLCQLLDIRGVFNWGPSGVGGGGVSGDRRFWEREMTSPWGGQDLWTSVINRFHCSPQLIYITVWYFWHVWVRLPFNLTLSADIICLYTLTCVHINSSTSFWKMSHEVFSCTMNTFFVHVVIILWSGQGLCKHCLNCGFSLYTSVGTVSQWGHILKHSSH